MKIGLKIFFVSIFFIISLFPLTAQEEESIDIKIEEPVVTQEEENLDSMFDDPAADTVLANTDTDHLSQFVKNDGIKFSGSFTTTGAVIAGWKSWPVISDLTSNFDGTLGLVATANLIIDAKPSPDFRLYGTVVTSMDPLTSPTWSGIAIGELFVDYTWLENIFIRMGKYGVTWGQGKLFGTVTNIMADNSTGYALRFGFPTLLDGISISALMNRAQISSYTQICYSMKLDKVFAGFLVSLGLRYQIDEGAKALLSMKRVIWGVDFLADVALSYKNLQWQTKIVANFFKEWPEVKLTGEYYYEGSTPGGLDHSLALACGFIDIFQTSLDFGIQWKHTFFDYSGSVNAGITWKPWKYITAILVLPLAYGPDGSRYVASANPDPAKRRIGLAFTLEMSVSF